MDFDGIPQQDVFPNPVDNQLHIKTQVFIE